MKYKSVTGLKLCVILASLVVSYSSALVAQTLNANQGNGEVTFAGEHAGMEFKGLFETWQASLVLPPASNPKISATFQLDTAKTGDSIYDSTLPEGDWFDSEKFPEGSFESTQITVVDNGYQVEGNLRLKGISKPVSFILKNSTKGLSAQFEIDRLAYNIGLESDPEAEWVSQKIAMTVTINK